MDKNYHRAFLIFVVAQFFMVIGLLDYGTSIKALSDWLIIFTVCQLVGFILMVVASIKLYSFNKNYFYFFITSIICVFVAILGNVSKESTEDLTIAWSRGLLISADILLCIIYAYFFLGSKEYFLENGLERNAKRSKTGFVFVIAMTIAINLTVFVGSFNGIRTNYIAAAVFKYSSILMKFIMYTFMFVILVLMMIDMKKFKKEGETNEKQ